MNRYRRLRHSPAIRSLVRETTLSQDNLIQPFFVIEGTNKKEPVASMPGVFRYSPDLVVKAAEELKTLGGRGCLLFGVTGHKDKKATQAYAANGVVPTAIRALKKNIPELYVATDVCLCAYMDHGHCGVVHGDKVDNDETLPLLAQMAVSHAEAGADCVAPSDMMDLRVGAIREALDQRKLTDTAIMSYAAKYASAYYGPFRDAADSSPQSGDRKTYQMDPSNQREALKEAQQDIREGADIVMVKPALAYLDVVSLLRRSLDVPVAAYNVSGEYSMVKAAAERGWVDEKKIVLETLTAMKRAGADIIITYHAQAALTWIEEDRR